MIRSRERGPSSGEGRRARLASAGVIALGLCAAVPLTAVLAFFLAGAVAFPLIEPHYAGRVLASMGLMAVVYGTECVMHWGVIETCGFLSGHCTTHDLYPHAIVIWHALLVLVGLALMGWLLHRGRKR